MARSGFCGFFALWEALGKGGKQSIGSKKTSTPPPFPSLPPPPFQLPNLPIVGKGPKEKPLPVYPARVSEAGMIEVDV